MRVHGALGQANPAGPSDDRDHAGDDRRRAKALFKDHASAGDFSSLGRLRGRNRPTISGMRNVAFTTVYCVPSEDPRVLMHTIKAKGNGTMTMDGETSAA